MHKTPRPRQSVGTVESPVQAREAASLADVCPSADIGRSRAGSAGSAVRALRGTPELRATGRRRARGRRGERRAAELSSTRVLSARGHRDAGPGSPRAQCCSPSLSNSLVLRPTLLGAHEAAASPPAPVPDASPLQPLTLLPSAGRAPPSGPRRRLELPARRARSRGAGGGRAAPASALPPRASLAFPSGSEKAACNLRAIHAWNRRPSDALLVIPRQIDGQLPPQLKPPEASRFGKQQNLLCIDRMNLAY
ncbi:hypothetical protein NN561_008345 [Cricetulus griseus]